MIGSLAYPDIRSLLAAKGSKARFSGARHIFCGVASITNGASVMYLLMRKADVGSSYRFRTGSGTLVRPTYLATILRNVVFIGKTTIQNR